MILSREMLEALKLHRAGKGLVDGAVYGPELCDLGLLISVEGVYVCTALGHERLMAKEMQPIHLYLLSHAQCFQYSPSNIPTPCKQLVKLGFLDDEWLITEAGRVQLKKGLIL